MSETVISDVCDCKIGGQRRQYGLSGLDEEIVARRREDSLSLRDIARLVNTRILDAALETVEADVAGDPESVYETLAGDDVAPERKADLTDRLEFLGLDVDELRDDFVSHQTVKHHLNGCLDVDTSRSGLESIEDGKAQIQYSRDRHRTVLDSTIGQLVQTGELDIGEYELSQTASITCTDCSRSYRLEEFLDRGRCECE